jgi:cytochrome oxidase Cu insertion factor (SCO1/SenC/PrrC family)
LENLVSETIDPGKVRRGRIILVAIVAIFLLPFIAASIMYQQNRGGEVPELSSNGELIWPAVPLSPFSLHDARTTDTIDLDWVKNRWTLVYLSGDRCDAVCTQNIYHMRQIHIALGKEAHRVQRLAISDRPDSIATFIGDDYPRLNLASGSASDLKALYGQFHQAVREMPVQVESLFLVDPLGNLMMRFSPDLDPGGILKDIKRALRASQIG